MIKVVVKYFAFSDTACLSLLQSKYELIKDTYSDVIIPETITHKFQLNQLLKLKSQGFIDSIFLMMGNREIDTSQTLIKDEDKEFLMDFYSQFEEN